MEPGTSVSLNDLIVRLNRIESENQNLRDLLSQSQSQPQSQSQSQQPSQLHAQVPEPKVSLPEKFNGNRENFRTFINQLELVFLLNPSRYSTDALKVATAGTLLTGPAASWFNPLLEHPEENQHLLNDWSAFRALFKSTFSAVDPAIQAANDIRRLRQGNNSAVIYTTKFMQLKSDLRWDEDALIHQYRAGLSDEIKDMLIHYDYPRTVQEFSLLAIRLDARLAEHRQERARFIPQQGRAQPNAPPSQVHTQPTQMEVDAVRRGPLSSQERQHRITNRLCLVCGKHGHFKINCPLASRRNLSAITSASASAVEPLANELHVDHYSEVSRKPDHGARPHECSKITAQDNNIYSIEIASSFSSNVAPKVVLKAEIITSCGSFDVDAFIDSGADQSLIDSRLVKLHAIPVVKIAHPIALYLADGSPAVSSCVEYETEPLTLCSMGHVENITLYVTHLAYPLILGRDWLRKHNPDIDWRTLAVEFPSEFCHSQCMQTYGGMSDDSQRIEVAGLASDKLAERQYPFMETTSIDLEEPGAFPAALLDEFADVFDPAAARQLPPHSKYDFAIDLAPGFVPPHGKIYSLTQTEKTALKDNIRENLERGFIRKSTSPTAAPCFFVGKKDGSLRLVQDYRGLNAGTIKNRFPIPIISDLLRELSGAKIFTTLDLRGAYNLLRIKEGDEWKTSFICPEGQFEFLVMSLDSPTPLPTSSR